MVCKLVVPLMSCRAIIWFVVPAKDQKKENTKEKLKVVKKNTPLAAANNIFY